MSHAKKMPYCCYISYDNVACDKQPQWGIYPIPRDDPYDYTEACDEHVANMMQTSDQFYVTRLVHAI